MQCVQSAGAATVGDVLEGKPGPGGHPLETVSSRVTGDGGRL